MLRFITGLTGGGKTKLAVDRIIDDLRSTDYPIMYWMALELDPWVDGNGKAYPGLIATLRQEFGDDFDARRRLIALKEEQLLRFWAFRPIGRHRVTGEPCRADSKWADETRPLEVVELPEPTDGKFRLDGSVYGGCKYYFDEAHETFRKKDFNKVSDEALSWASQNRRAGDDCWMLSQIAGQVAKPFRDQSLECYWMVNHAYRTFGPWRQWDKISYRVYLTTPPGPGDDPMRKGDLTTRKGYLNGCYNTAKGATVAGGSADIGRRAKGLPWWTIPVGIVGICIASAFLFSGCVRLVSSGAKQAFDPAVDARTLQRPLPMSPAAAGSNVAAAVVASSVAQVAGPMPGTVGAGRPVKRAESKVTVKGWGGLSPRVIVQLSDGTYKHAAQVIPLGPGAVIVDGVEYEVR